MTDLIQQGGYLGIAVLMLAENLFPPIPSELIMPLAGFAAARGELNVVLVILFGALGSLLGVLFWYYIGKWVGGARVRRWAQRHGRWLTIAPQDVDRAEAWFRRHGGKAVFLGRLIPAIRTLISIPAGIAGMTLGPFLLFSALGTTIWTTILTMLGYLLESEYSKVADYVDPISHGVVGLLVILYLYRVITHRRRSAM